MAPVFTFFPFLCPGDFGQVCHVTSVQLVDQLLLLLQGEVAAVQGVLDGLLDVVVRQLELVPVIRPGVVEGLAWAGQTVEEDGLRVRRRLTG